jgi:hypothetical protein
MCITSQQDVLDMQATRYAYVNLTQNVARKTSPLINRSDLSEMKR